MYNVKKITTHKLLCRLLKDKLPQDITHHISKYVGKYFKVNIPKKWIRLKYPREKRLVKVYY
jgi:hypothetical protein